MFKSLKACLTRETKRQAPVAALLGGAAIVLIGGANAQAQTDYAAIEASPALWSISDEDSTVYLFGTVHILPPQLDWRTEEITSAFVDAETLYFEVDALSPEAQAQMQALVPQLGLNAPGVTLSSMISDEARDYVAVIAERIGAPADAFMSQLDPLQPWLASLQMAVLQMQAAGYQPGSGVEAALTAEAEEAGKEFGYFETVEEQLRFISGSSMEVQIADFEIGVQQMVEDPDVLTELVQAWAVGDMEHIDQLINGEMRETSPELYGRLIVERNHNWIPQILAALEGSEDAFVAVGAGHMPGEEGVIALLEAEGVTVTRR
ncbi:MAG: TraB/GumN family protein [Alphaproteobacteria bacterium]|nr:TraB/GumN family protein [Alphaproteobacteria bacterium]